MPGLRIRRKPPPRSPDTAPAGAARCRIPTLIKRATGSSDRYALSAVRALPLRYRGKQTSDLGFRHNVILQASDGHQAVCVLTEGAIEQPTLILGGVLPIRQPGRNAGVTIDGDTWRSCDGREATVLDPGAEFPAIGPVLPEVVPGTVAVAICIDRLRRVAAGLGTDDVTLLVPPARKTPGKPKAPATVRDPVGVCAAGKDGTEGVAVMLPVACERGQAYYKRVRDAVRKAELPHKGKTTRGPPGRRRRWRHDPAPTRHRGPPPP